MVRGLSLETIKKYKKKYKKVKKNKKREVKLYKMFEPSNNLILPTIRGRVEVFGPLI